MSAFDAKVSVQSVSIGTPPKEAIDAGEAAPIVEVAVNAGLALPIADPTNPNQPLVVPAGTIRFEFTREQAQEVFSHGLEAAEQLPADTPVTSGKLVTDTNMSQVEAAAKRMQEVTQP